jgi:hypothetical protein
MGSQLQWAASSRVFIDATRPQYSETVRELTQRIVHAICSPDTHAATRRALIKQMIPSRMRALNADDAQHIGAWTIRNRVAAFLQQSMSLNKKYEINCYSLGAGRPIQEKEEVVFSLTKTAAGATLDDTAFVVSDSINKTERHMLGVAALHLVLDVFVSIKPQGKMEKVFSLANKIWREPILKIQNAPVDLAALQYVPSRISLVDMWRVLEARSEFDVVVVNRHGYPQLVGVYKQASETQTVNVHKHDVMLLNIRSTQPVDEFVNALKIDLAHQDVNMTNSIINLGYLPSAARDNYMPAHRAIIQEWVLMQLANAETRKRIEFIYELGGDSDAFSLIEPMTTPIAYRMQASPKRPFIHAKFNDGTGMFVEEMVDYIYQRRDLWREWPTLLQRHRHLALRTNVRNFLQHLSGTQRVSKLLDLHVQRVAIEDDEQQPVYIIQHGQKAPAYIVDLAAAIERLMAYYPYFDSGLLRLSSEPEDVSALVAPKMANYASLRYLQQLNMMAKALLLLPDGFKWVDMLPCVECGRGASPLGVRRVPIAKISADMFHVNKAQVSLYYMASLLVRGMAWLSISSVHNLSRTSESDPLTPSEITMESA